MDLLNRLNGAAKELGIDRLVMDVAERVVLDTHPSLEHAYLFAQTKDNEQSLFLAAQQMLHDGLAGKFLIIGGAEANGFPGYGAWRKRLGKTIASNQFMSMLAVLGFTPNVQRVLLANRYQVNTLTESQAMAAHAQKHSMQHLYVVAAPFHQLRAVMTAASEAVRHERAGKNKLNLFSYAGASLPWEEEVLHSQGILRATRSKLVRHELERIQRYQAKGDILPARDLLAYLDRRTTPPQQRQAQR